LFVTRASQLTEDSVQVEVADLDCLLGDFYIGINISMMKRKRVNLQVSLMLPLGSQIFSLRLVSGSMETGERPGIAVAAADAKRVGRMRLV
jgi:hypothetical protein